MPPLPSVVAHADWSVHSDKRWLVLARLRADGSYRADASRPVGPLGSLWARLGQEAGGGQALLGVDFPIGLPRAYAQRAGMISFSAALREFGDRFYAVAHRQDEIGLRAALLSRLVLLPRAPCFRYSSCFLSVRIPPAP